MGEKGRASLRSAAVVERRGKQRRRIGTLETSVPKWYMSRARVVGSYRGGEPMSFEPFGSGVSRDLWANSGNARFPFGEIILAEILGLYSLRCQLDP